MKETAIVTGITGQDGYYLTKHLISQGINVVGVKRRTSGPTPERLNEFSSGLIIQEADITDANSVNILMKRKPTYFFNLAAMSHVHTSFQQPAYTFDVNTKGVVNVLESIRLFSPKTKFYQASTSEMFGKNFKTKDYDVKYQDETTEMVPQSPYGVAKLAAHELVRIYRDSYDLFACSGILYNHESKYRGDNFLTRKVTKWLGEYSAWRAERPLGVIEFDEDNIIHPLSGHSFPKLRLGNLDAYRDWGHADDYCQAMIKMLKHNIPDDYVVSTGETRPVRSFVELAFMEAMELNYKDYVVIDPEFYRPCEVDYLLGDCSKVKSILGWEPKKTFLDIVSEMVEYDKKEAGQRS